MASVGNGIARQRTALRRTALSRPVARAIEDGLITPGTDVLDYGCGRGGDVERLSKLGIACRGYDPSFRPHEPRTASAVVNLGFVVNVIEDEQEREQVLLEAWKLARRVLVVAARLASEASGVAATEHGDGVVTGLGTFQKFYRQDELRLWVERTLGVAVVASEPGIFYAFRDLALAESFLLHRVRRRVARPRRSEAVFAEHEDVLRDLMDFIEVRGRLPRAAEFAREAEVREQLGSLRRAFLVIKTVTGEERWDRARVSRYEDVLVHLALSRFRRRPRFSHLPQELQHDVKEFFGSYRAAINQAERTLFSVGEQWRVAEAITAARVGKRMPSALYVHRSGIADLPVALRVLEGCARELIGDPPDASIVKFDVDRPRVAYLEYPDFDNDPHPALRGTHIAELDTLYTDFRDYSARENPPILHRKERFIPAGYPKRQAFERLTRQEVKAGLFADPSRIGNRRGWQEVLDREGVVCRGHRLCRKTGR